MNATIQGSWQRPPAWKIVLAFGLVYISWGTTYFAIRTGVHTYHLPPALFGGLRVSAAGLILLGYLRLRGEPLRIPRRELIWIAVSGLLLFVGGNFLINVALDRIESGLVSVLVTTTPLWTAVMETSWPGGDRLTARGWLGLLTGLGGVLILLTPQIHDKSPEIVSVVLVLGSTLAWALASLILRYRERIGSHLVAASFQMIVGGSALAVVGVCWGELQELSADKLTLGGLGAFFYLLIVGSLIGFVAFNWLLGHVSAALVGTYAYVNPVVAILVGTLLGAEQLTGWILGGMCVILASVALVRGKGVRPSKRALASSAERILERESEEGSEPLLIRP